MCILVASHPADVFTLFLSLLEVGLFLTKVHVCFVNNKSVVSPAGENRKFCLIDGCFPGLTMKMNKYQALVLKF